MFKLFAIYGSAAACEDGIHAHETECDTFYQCANGHRYEDQKCPEGLNYNAAAQYCDWPENVTCPQVGCADGIHAHETNCNMFYQCNAGHRYEDQSCPEGLLYNPEAEYCDWPENVDCGGGSDWDCYTDCVGDKWWSMTQAAKCSKECYGWNKKSAAAPKEAEACEDGMHAHETKCDTFYQCNAGHQYEDQQCPDGLMYNAEAEYCDWPENVTCPEPPMKCKKGDRRAHESDCKKFYECKWFNKETEKKCGHGQIFNAKKSECDFMYKPWVNCNL